MFNNETQQRLDKLETRIDKLECETRIGVDAYRSIDVGSVLFLLLNHLKLKVSHSYESNKLEKSND